MSSNKIREKPFAPNQTDPHLKHHLPDFGKTAPVKDLTEKVGRCSSYDQIQRQKQNLLRRLSNFTTNPAIKPPPNISITPNNQLASSYSLSQSLFSTGTTPSKKHNYRSKSNIRQNIGKPTNSLNQSLSLFTGGELNASFTKIPRPTNKKASVSSLNRTFHESVAPGELDLSHQDLNISRCPQMNDLLDLETEKKEETKKTNVLNSTNNSYGASSESDTDKKVREIIHKYQLRDAIHRQEISKLKQNNMLLQVQLNKSEIELKKFQKQNKKDSEAIHELDKEVRLLKERLRDRSRDARRSSIDLKKGSIKGPSQNKSGGLGKEENPSKVNTLSQKLEDLTAEKLVLEDMLKNALFTIEKSKFQSTDKKITPLTDLFNFDSQKLPSMASNSKRSQSSLKPKIPLRPKDLNISSVLSPDYQSNVQLNPLDKSFYGSERPVMSTKSSKSRSGSYQLQNFPHKESEKSDAVQEEGESVKPQPFHDLQSFVNNYVTEQNTQMACPNSNSIVIPSENVQNDDGDSIKEAVFQQPNQSSGEDESDLESCSGRISPQSMVLRNIKFNDSFTDQPLKANKFNLEKLKLDLSRLKSKKNY